MKKLLLGFILIGAVMLIGSNSANSQSFDKGDKFVNAGVGIASLGGYVSGEFMVQDNIGVGPIIGYNTYTYGGIITGYSGDNYRYGQIRAGLRGAYHLAKILNLEDGSFSPYAAVGVGLLFDRGNYFYDFNTNSLKSKTTILPFVNPRIGTNFKLDGKLLFYGDLGYGGSWIQAGVTFKL
jgi:hypothetical protein